MTELSFDFETRSRADLPKVGAYAYAQDPSTEALCLAVSIDGGEPITWDRRRRNDEVLRHVGTLIDGGAKIRGWNSPFDVLIWNHALRREIEDLPLIGWGQTVDTAAESAAMNAPQGLDEAAVQLGLPEEYRKDKRGKYLIQKLSKPQRNGEFCEDEALHDEMVGYCAQDVRAESNAARKLRRLPPVEHALWVLTQTINDRGLPIDIRGVERILVIIAAEAERLEGEFQSLVGGAFRSGQRAEFVSWIAAQGVAGVTSIAAEAMAPILSRNDLPDHVRKALALRQKLTQTSLAKFDTMLSLAVRGRLHGLLTYHGAATGRYASRGGFNAQNLPRGKFPTVEAAEFLAAADHETAALVYGDDLLDACVASIRGMVRASEGRTFVDVDFSSVENRCGVWLAGHQRKVEMFAAGLDEYKVFASESLFHVPYAEVSKHQRQVSKSAVLGCMFGQGAKGLVEYAKGFGVELSEEEAAGIVARYRMDYEPVKDLWYACEKACIQAVKAPGAVFQVGSSPLRVQCKDDQLVMRLPSGRLLTWRHPRLEQAQDLQGRPRWTLTAWFLNTYSRQWGRNKLYGSSIYQSAVQGMARDLLRDAMFECEKEGFPIVLTVHDEILAEVQIPHAEAALASITRIMSTAPAWAPGLPLAAEGWIGERYRK